MSKQEEWEVAIATYQKAYLDLIRLGVVLLESGQDLVRLKETVDGLGETEAKELLTVAAASAAKDNVDMRRGAKLN